MYQKITCQKIRVLKMAGISQRDIKTVLEVSCQIRGLVTLGQNIKNKMAYFRSKRCKQLFVIHYLKISGGVNFDDWQAVCADLKGYIYYYWPAWEFEIFTGNVFWGHLLHCLHCLQFKTFYVKKYLLERCCSFFRPLLKNFALFRAQK